MNRNHIMLGVTLTAAALIASLVLYPQLPDRLPVHWNIHGKVDRYGAKEWAAFLMPGIMLLLLLLFLALPWLSPRSFEVDTFRSTYQFVAILVISLMGYIHALTLWAGLGNTVDVSRALVGGICLFFAMMGNVMGKVRRNFWIGVRTPWTLANERVWNDTHRLAARLLVLTGLLGCVASFAGLPLAISFVLIMTGALVPCVYSLIEYKQLQRRGEA